jgi:hypothetical protein
MKLVRIVSEIPSDAADLIFFLESHGFVIQTGQSQDPSQPPADFEIDLRVLPVDDALHLAREMASSEVDVLIAPGAFVDAEPLVEAEPFVEAQPVVEPEPLVQAERFIEVPPFLEPELLTQAEPEALAPFIEAQAFAEAAPFAEPEPMQAESEALAEPFVEAQAFVDAAPSLDPEPEPLVQAEPLIEAQLELAAYSQAQDKMPGEEFAVNEFTVEELTTEELVVQELTVEETTAPAEEQLAQPLVEPDPVISSKHLRESISQVLAEAGLTARECLALCSAELLNGSEHARQWLTQARVLVVRKRALVETRALRARAIVENRLRFDSTSQNAWIRSAFAGAGLMIVLLALMLWKDQRLAPANSGSLPDSGAASVLKSAPSGTRSVDTGTSTPVTAGLHRRLSSDRGDLVDDREVIIRHFARPTPKRAAVIDAKSGIKHISDMN